MGVPSARNTVEPVHDFARKLRQPGLFPQVQAYLAWARESRAAKARGEAPPTPPTLAPLSINLDLTTACNYACDHCIDWDMLNPGVSHADATLSRSVEPMAERGQRSV